MIVILAAGCGQDHSTPTGHSDRVADRPPVIYTVNYPLQWMAQQLATDAATVIFPVPPTDDPAYWQPDIDTLLQYQQADMVLLNGANYAKWVASASLPASRLVDTSAAYREQLLSDVSGPAHNHGVGGEHSHGELAFTTWLDLELARQQAQAVALALQRQLPADAAAIAERLTGLQQVLADMDSRLLKVSGVLGDTPLLYSHPVYQYLQRRYQLNGQALHWEPGQLPDEAQWQALASLLQSHPAQVMLWEDHPLPEVATRLAEMGVSVVVFSPLGNRPPRGDFNSNMTEAIEALTAAAQQL